MKMNTDHRSTPRDFDGADGFELDDFFAAARAAPVAVPDALLARVLASADALQPEAPPLAAPAGKSRGFASWRGWAGLWAALGGGASFAGLGVAAVLGVWLGFVQPFDVDMRLGLQAATLEGLDLFPSELEQWSEALSAELSVEE